MAYRIVYCISDETQRAGKQVTAQTKEKHKGFWRRKVIDFHWAGGAVADLLNADTELKAVLLGLGETPIEIEPHKRDECVRIFGPEREKFSPPSKQVFEAYDRIAGHVRRAMTLWPDEESG